MVFCIRQRFKLLDVPYDLKAILSNELPDVAVSAGGSEHFNALYGEHLRRKLLGQVLNGRDGPKKMLGPFIQMPIVRPMFLFLRFLFL
jgi:hypothetical protein